MTVIDVYSPWASNGSIGTYRLRMYAWQVSQDVVNNTSLVRAQVWIQAGSQSWFTNIGSAHYQSIAGAVVLNNVVINRSVTQGGSSLVMDNSVTVPHNADGTGSALAYAAFSNTFTGLHEISGTVTLTTIPRATTPNWSGNFTTNSATSINLPRASTSFTHDVTFSFGSASGTIATGATTSTSWTPNRSLLTNIPNSTSGIGTITTVTKSGSTVIGTVNSPFTLVADGGVIPTISSITWTDDNGTVATNIGAYVQNVSRIRGAASSSGVFGSTINNESITVGSTTVAENVPVLVTASGTVNGSATATDTRGRVGSLTSNLSVLAYTTPTINSFQVRRATSGGTPSDTGTYLRMDLNAVVSSLLVSSVQKNNMTIQVRTRPTNGAWTNRNTITGTLPSSALLTYNTNVLITGGAAFAIASSYEAEITVSDRTGAQAAQVVVAIPTATVTLDLNGANVGIGKYHTQGALDVNGNIHGSQIFGTNISASGNLTVTGETFLNGTEIQGDGKTMFRYSDAWLRINDQQEFTSGIYAGSGRFRTDGNFQVGDNGGVLNVNGSTFTHLGNPVGIPGQNGLPFRMASGSGTTSASAQVTVTLPAGRFAFTPNIVAQIVYHPNVSVPYINTSTNTSFGIGAFTIGGARIAATVQWQAVQMTSGGASG
jgi:hypothetical protein